MTDDYTDFLLGQHDLSWVESSTAEAIAEARKAGKLNALLGIPVPLDTAAMKAAVLQLQQSSSLSPNPSTRSHTKN